MDEKILAQFQAEIDRLRLALIESNATVMAQDLVIKGLEREILLKRMDQSFEPTLGVNLH